MLETMESTESMEVDVGDRINTRVIDLARGEELFALHDIMACDVYINFLRSWFQEVMRFLAVTLQFGVSVVGNALQQIGTVRVSKKTHTTHLQGPHQNISLISPQQNETEHEIKKAHEKNYLNKTAARDKDDREIPELPQVRRAIEEDAKFKINTTILMRPNIEGNDANHQFYSRIIDCKITEIYTIFNDDVDINETNDKMRSDKPDSNKHAGAVAATATTNRKSSATHVYTVSLYRTLGMVGWQNAQPDKQKHKPKKHALRPFQQQHAATALRLGEAKSPDEYGLHTSGGGYKNLDAGKYEKTVPSFLAECPFVVRGANN